MRCRAFATLIFVLQCFTLRAQPQDETNKRPTSEIKRAAKEQGMTFLRESAVAKILTGVTTLKEINKVTFID